MRISPSLSRYVAREVLLYTGLGLAAVSLVFVGRNLLRTLAELAGAGVAATEVATVFGCLALASLAYALPVGFLFGTLCGVARLAADREALAFRCSGLGLRQVLVPVVVLGGLVAAFDALLVIDLEPRAKRELRRLLGSALHASAWLEPGRFTQVGAHTVWVGQRQGRSLGQVFVSDRSDPAHPLWVFAERGELLAGEGQGPARLRLRDGDLHRSGGGAEWVRFAGLEFPLPEGAGAGPGRWAPRPKDLSLPELLEAAAAGDGSSRAHRVQLERRLALPLAPLLFSFSAVPLALRRRSGARSFALFGCVALVVGYYALLAGGEHLALSGQLPPRLGLWAPNVALAAAGAWLVAWGPDRPD